MLVQRLPAFDYKKEEEVLGFYGGGWIFAD
jgi:hypothetical protein